MVAESVAILLYIAEKSGRLVPTDVKGRTTVMQWCFAWQRTLNLAAERLRKSVAELR